MSTALLTTDTDTADAALAGVGEVHAVLDRLHACSGSAVRGGGQGRLVAELDRAAHRIEALKLKVVAAADQRGTAADAGFADTGAWVARQTTSSRSSAAGVVALATELASGHDTTAAALDQGLVSPGHAAVIVRAGRNLPDGVSQTQREAVEAHLVTQARRLDPDQLRRFARRAVAEIEPEQSVVDAHENEQVRSEEEVARDRSRLTFHDNGDGTTTGHFTVASASMAFLRKIIDSMTAPRRMRPLRSPRDRRPRDRFAEQDRRYDWDHRRGLAFAELLEHLPTDHLHDKTAATVVVTLDHHTLQGALKAAHLDTGHTISAGEARRLACGAGLVPAVLGGASVALDLGRETRLFSQSQRVALGLAHHSCAADGCDRPYAWCELHHERPWSHGGRTDLDNAVPLCHYHHQRIHDHAFWHRYLPDGTIRFSRRT